MTDEGMLRTPSGLQGPGKALWERVTDRFVLTAAELSVLIEAARTADELGRLERALRSAELLVLGSTGQPRANPLLAEVRNHRVVLERLLAALGLPDDEEEVGHGLRSTQAKAAARARWKEGHRVATKEDQSGQAS